MERALTFGRSILLETTCVRISQNLPPMKYRTYLLVAYRVEH
jgi:hypothetical protein